MFDYGKPQAKTMADWEEHALLTGDYGLDSYLKPGDMVGQDMVDHFANLVPPALMRESLFQVGTPYDSQPGSDGQMHPTFATFSEDGGAWKFCGYRFLGKVDEPVRDPSLLPSEGGCRPEYDYVTSYGQLERVALNVSAYESGGLRLVMESFDRDMGEQVSFADMTMDVGKTLPPLTAVIDVETHGEEVVEFLTENGFGEPTGERMAKGERAYPLLCLNESKLVEADPRGFERYCQANSMNLEQGGVDKKSLDVMKANARERAREKNLGHSERSQSKRFDQEL